MILKYIIVIFIILIILKRIYLRENFISKLQGPKGLTGNFGYQGDVGYIGLQGDPGPPGLKGIPGIQGPKGAMGVGGFMGSPGLDGQKGNTGFRGRSGVRGETGIQGLEGDLGDTGPKGLVGDNGIRGVSGANGDQGDYGAMGTEGTSFSVKKELAHPYTRDFNNLNGNINDSIFRGSTYFPGNTMDKLRYPSEPVPVFGKILIEKNSSWWAKCSPGEFLSNFKLTAFTGSKYNPQTKKFKDGNTGKAEKKNLYRKTNHLNQMVENISLECSKAVMKTLVNPTEEEWWDKYPKCCKKKNRNDNDKSIKSNFNLNKMDCSWNNDKKGIGRRQSKSKFECEDTFKGKFNINKRKCCTKSGSINDVNYVGYCSDFRYLTNNNSPINTDKYKIEKYNHQNDDYKKRILNGPLLTIFDLSNSEKLKNGVFATNSYNSKSKCLDACKENGFKYGSYTNLVENMIGFDEDSNYIEDNLNCRCSNRNNSIINENGTGVYDVSTFASKEVNYDALKKNITDIECIEQCEQMNSNYTGSVKKNYETKKFGCFCSLKNCPNKIIDTEYKTFVGKNYQSADCSFDAVSDQQKDSSDKNSCSSNYGLFVKPELNCPGNRCIDKHMWKRMNPKCCNGSCTKEKYLVKKKTTRGGSIEDVVDFDATAKKKNDFLLKCNQEKGQYFSDEATKLQYCCKSTSCNFDSVSKEKRESSDFHECDFYGGAWTNMKHRCVKQYDTYQEYLDISNFYNSQTFDLDELKKYCKDNEGDLITVNDYNVIPNNHKIYYQD